MNRHAVATVDEVREAGQKIVDVNGIELGIFEVNGEFHAWRNVCPHIGAPVCKGKVSGTRLPSMVYEYEYGSDRQILRCPWHGWEFDLKSGSQLANPTVKLRGLPVEVDNGTIFVLTK